MEKEKKKKGKKGRNSGDMMKSNSEEMAKLTRETRCYKVSMAEFNEEVRFWLKGNNFRRRLRPSPGRKNEKTSNL